MVVNGKWFDINGIGENEIPIVDNASFVADELDNVAFVNMAEEHLANYNKQIWFVESMLK